MSTRPISINGKPFNIELVTYKAGTEELLNVECVMLEVELF